MSARPVAVVDIGSNSTRLLIAAVADGRIEAEIDRRTTVTRLGAGVDASGALSDDSQRRVLAVLAEYRNAIAHACADPAVAVLTSAVRDAANGQDFAATVRERYGLAARIIDGDEEARLTYLGATGDRSDRATSDQAAPASVVPSPSGAEATATPNPPTAAQSVQPQLLVVDIGGGSTEVILGRGAEPSFHASLQAGVVRQTERHLREDPPSERELRLLAEDVRGLLDDSVPARQRNGVDTAIAVAGTPTQLASYHQRLARYDPSRVHGHVLERDTIAEMLARLARLPLAERKRERGLHPERAELIIAGSVILLEVMDAFGVARVEVSEHDILRGAALAAADGHWPA